MSCSMHLDRNLGLFSFQAATHFFRWRFYRVSKQRNTEYIIRPVNKPLVFALLLWIFTCSKYFRRKNKTARNNENEWLMWTLLPLKVIMTSKVTSKVSLMADQFASKDVNLSTISEVHQYITTLLKYERFWALDSQFAVKKQCQSKWL